MFLRWLYYRNKQKFWDFIVSDFYGDIPDEIKAPSIEFMANGRQTLERFFSLEAYNIQRRSISDPKNSQIYQGFLLHIRVLLAVITKGKIGPRPEVVTENKKEESAFKKIEDFVKLGKERLIK